MACEPIRSKAQIQELKDQLGRGKNGFRNKLFLEFSLATALRVSDVLALKKEDVDGRYVRVLTKKTNQYRFIELNPIFSRMLDMHLESLRADDLIFDFGRIMAWKMITDAADQVGIKNISTHSLRKTAAWHFYYNTGKDMFLTMKLLGHEESRETRVYLQIAEDEVNQELSKMYL